MVAALDSRKFLWFRPGLLVGLVAGAQQPEEHSDKAGHHDGD
jgi:hypothetical protein